MVRRLLAGAALGLPVALLAHALVFGRSHSVGGSSHALLTDLAFVILAAALAAGSLHVAFARVAEGSIIAAAIRAISPNLAMLGASGFVWLAAIELIGEGTRELALLPMAVAILAAALFANAALKLAIRVIAGAIAGVSEDASTAIVEGQNRARLPAPALRQTQTHRFRIFSRPPPAFA